MIAGDPGAVEAAARDVAGGGRGWHDDAAAMRGTARSLDASWAGAASTVAIAVTEALTAKLGSGGDTCVDVAPVLTTFAAALRAAQQQYAGGLAQADQGGRSLAGLGSGATATADAARDHATEQVATGQAAMGAAEEAARVANVVAAGQIDALTAQLAALGAAAPDSAGPAPTDAVGTGGLRGPDERGGRRLRSDEVAGRPEGGDGSNGNFDSDWAGRAILERYLRGGDDWTIDDDPDWTRYMTDNPLLRATLLDRTQATAQDALARFRRGEGTRIPFQAQESAEVQNGESIVGYQYLHGTDRNAGGFRRDGTSDVVARPDGNYEVRVGAHYQWNDKIDPNPQYSTDRTKSTIAEVLTLGRADPYDIHIGWQSESTVVLDPQGNVLEVHGYPGR